MKHPNEVKAEMVSIDTIVNLTGIFEGIASLKIAQIKNQVLQSQNFFRELWDIYTQLRVDATFHFGRGSGGGNISDKELFIVITAEGGFSGDIDERLIKTMLKDFDKEKHDIIVIGHHGAIQLAQRGVKIKKYYKLPSRDKNINVSPIIAEIQKYRASSAYYQQYVSLMVQDTRKISMMAAVQEQGRTAEDDEPIGRKEISERNYIFEPSTYAVVDHLERSMLSIMLSQIILDSKLAQYASRFRAMSAANDRAKENHDDLTLEYNRSRRALADERLKEIVASMKKARKT